jgi:uncharacterized sulfatase
MNLLFLIVEDLNARALGCYGNAAARTPNIDRLAQRGVLFPRAYCQYPLCNPSRASLLSGLRPDTTGVCDNRTHPRRQKPDIEFLPEYFARHGYFTARAGKVLQHEFEDAARWNETQSAADREAKADLQTRMTQHWRATDNDDSEEPDGIHARQVASWIENCKSRFFIAAGFLRPHLPFVAPRKYFEMFPSENIELPPEPPDNHRATLPAVSLASHYYPQMSDQQRRATIAHYYACTSFMDAQVGVVLDALERSGHEQDTVVIFTADHGWHLGDHGGLWAKNTLFEDACRVPLIISAPQLPRDAKVQEPVELVDLFPTLCELCELPPPKNLDGKSLVPLLNGEAARQEYAAFTQTQRGGGMGRTIRTRRWRYTRWANGECELYNHINDEQEYSNLAAEPGYTKERANLQDELAMMVRI